MSKNSKTTNDSVPRWDLSSIYDGFYGKGFKKSIMDLKGCINFLEALLLDFRDDSFFKFLNAWLDIEDAVLKEFYSLHAYCEAISSTDTTNTQALNNIALLDKIRLDISDCEIRFMSHLAENEWQLNEFFEQYPDKAEYKFILNEKVEQHKHLMSEEEENLAQDLQRNGGDAWSRLQGQLISNLVDKETGKTFNQLRNDAYSPDRELRKDSYNREIALLKDSEIALAACLNNIKGATTTLNARRSWNNAIDRSLASSRISKKTLQALIGAIEKSLPFWEKYLQVKAKHITGNEACDFYDIFAPLPCKEKQDDSKIWTFKEAKDYIIDRYYSFSDDMGDFVVKAFRSKWIDAEVRKGKVGGAYCTSMPRHRESRVLTNFTGVFNDVLTLAHELGHAYHDSCINHKSFVLSEYPMTLAETASIFAETIVMKDMLSKTSGYEKAKLCETHLSDGCQVLVDILSRYYFEKSVMERKADDEELSAQDFCELMLDAQKRTYGKGLSDVKHPYMWAMKVHYYSPELDFYNFPYAFGQLFALSLYNRYETEGKDFTEVYKNLLSETGSDSCENICKKAGFDIESESFWLNGIKQFESDLEVLEQYE